MKSSLLSEIERNDLYRKLPSERKKNYLLYPLSHSVAGSHKYRQSKSAKLKHMLLSSLQDKKEQTISNPHGIITAYSANTNQGIVRNYNEDRVTIILNFTQPKDRQMDYWPKCAFFGVYDGHGGCACSEFLRDYLHHFVII
jgi:hypothetical protein